MQELVINIMGVLLYASGLFVWPISLLLSRNTGRRLTVSRWVFLAELACQLVLVGFAVFWRGLLAFGYSWLILMILVNLGFTPLALGAALYDYHRDEQPPDD